MDTKVTFQDLYFRVAPAEKTLPEEKTVLKLAEAAHWAVSRFENDGRWVCEIFTENTPLPNIAKERKATIEREIVKETGIEWQIEWAVAHEINTQPIKVPDIHIDDEQAEQVLKGLAVAAGIVVAAAFIIPLLFLAAFAGAEGAAKCMKEIALPPFITCRLCRNRVNQSCLEDCAPARDYRWFELGGVSIDTIPEFPLEEWEKMPSKVRGLVVAAYLKVIVDHLQGKDHERVTYSERCRRISNHLPVTALSLNPAEEDPARQALRKAYRDKAERPNGVAGKEDGS